MSDPDPRRLQDQAEAALLTWSQRQGPRLAAVWASVAERLGLGQGAEPGYFLHPLALPVLQLPGWIAATCAARGAPVAPTRVDLAVEAAVFGYLHVRVQDDLLDEGTGDPAEATMLAEALGTRHHALMARVAGDDVGFWTASATAWDAYAESMLLERALCAESSSSAWDAAVFERLLDRSRAMVLPPLAIATAAGLGAATEPGLRRIVDGLVRAHQLLVDLIDVDKDLAHGNPTWIIARFGGLESRSALRQRLYLGGGLDEVIAEIHESLDDVGDAARGLEFDELVDWTATRRARTVQVQQAAFEAMFRTVLEG